MKTRNFIGVNVISEAIEAKHPIEKILVCKDYHGNSFVLSLLKKARDAQIPIKYVPQQKIFKLSKSPKAKILALSSPIEYHSFENLLDNELQKKSKFVLLLLDGVTDVRNFGAIVRTAVATGVAGVVISNHHSVGISTDAITASSGAIFKIPIVRVNHLKDVIYQLLDHQIPVLGLDEKSDHSLFETPLNRTLALVAGDESKGISRGIKKLLTKTIGIPISNQMSSLNVSVACGIALYQLYHHKINTQNLLPA